MAARSARRTAAAMVCLSLVAALVATPVAALPEEGDSTAAEGGEAKPPPPESSRPSPPADPAPPAAPGSSPTPPPGPSEGKEAPQRRPEEPGRTVLTPGDTRTVFSVVFIDGSGVRLRGQRFVSTAGQDVSEVNAALDRASARVERLFTAGEDALDEHRRRLEHEAGKPSPDLNLYYRIRVGEEQIAALLSELDDMAVVRYVEPEPAAASLPVMTPDGDAQPEPAEATSSSVTPNFVARQGYRHPAPTGVDARYASGVAGGKGNKVKVVDLEWDWRQTHEDLTRIKGKLITTGTPAGTTQGNRNHGTAVMGELVGDNNGFGVTGIVPAAVPAMVNVQTTSGFVLADALQLATANSVPGDVILVEVQITGPNWSTAQSEYVPVEWNQTYYDLIKAAADAGRIMVIAGGNGYQDLDGDEYRNRFNRAARDSGSILVGAGAAPDCAQQWGSTVPARGRLQYSNHGGRVDLQGWGSCVTTTGYGSLQGGGEDRWFTAGFAGTSSASPIVAGAAASLSGIVKARGKSELTSSQARYLLGHGATPQTIAGAPAGHIGPLPNLRNAVPALTLLNTNICAPDDAFEPNDTRAQATPLGLHRQKRGILCPKNADFFRVRLPQGTTATADLRFLHANGDLDLRLYDAHGTEVANALSETDDERIVHPVATTGYYYLRVEGWRGASNRYALSVTTPICPPDDELEPNDSITQATALERGKPRAGITCPHNSDYFAVELFAGTAATLDATFAHFFGDVDMALRDGHGTVVANARSETNNETITFTPQSTGTYYAQVYAWPPDYAANRYRLTLSGEAPTVPDAPTNVGAAAGSGEARVSWTAPDDGGSAIVRYRVRSAPGGHTAMTAGTATTATVPGLANDTAYTFTVRASNGVGHGPWSSPSNAVTPTATSGDLIVSAVSDPPASRQQGGTFAVTDTTANIGSDDAGESRTRYYLSADGVLDAGDHRLIGARPVPALTADADHRGRRTVTIPTGAPARRYWLLACADDTKTVAESDEANNCLRATGNRILITQP